MKNLMGREFSRDLKQVVFMNFLPVWAEILSKTKCFFAPPPLNLQPQRSQQAGPQIKTFQHAIQADRQLTGS